MYIPIKKKKECGQSMVKYLPVHTVLGATDLLAMNRCCLAY